MVKPWIGIPARYHAKTEYFGQLRHYTDAVLWAGGLPLMIPPVEDRSVIQAYLDQIEGVLLPGSPTDIDPAHYGAGRHEKLGRLYPERDSTDFLLIDHAEQKDLPLLGICFGIQSLNVYRGGTLVQDIPSLVARAEVHDRDNEDPDGPARHKVHLEEGSMIAGLAGKSEVEVNSYHHQAVERPGRHLRLAAVAPDGVIEALEDTRGRFIVGVQWHPERGWRDNPLSKALFKSLVEKASAAANGLRGSNGMV
jgi:putative glutamine amidotransferase